jgi:hypothetical protein
MKMLTKNPSLYLKTASPLLTKNPAPEPEDTSTGDVHAQ